MYSMVLMAALTTGTDMPDFGRHRGAGCCGGCYGGMSYGGCYGGGWGGGYGGCYGGGYARGGYGGCYGGGWGGGYGGGRSAWGGGYGSYSGGYVLSGFSPWTGYVLTPSVYNSNSMIVEGNTPPANSATQSFYPDTASANQKREATIIVHLPPEATLTVDGQPTQSRAGTRVFVSPPLEPGKVYTYKLHAEANRDGHMVGAERTVDVQAGRPTEINMNFDNSKAPAGQILNSSDSENQVAPPATRRTPPATTNPAPRTPPAPPR